MAIANGGNDMDKNEVMKILEAAKDKNGEIPMRLVRQAFEKLPERCEDCGNFDKTQLLIPQPEPTERIYKRGYADGYHKAEKDYFERTQKYRDDAFIAGIETEKEIVRKWLLAYHRMSFDLMGRYLPHEVISWLVNDISKKLFDEGGQE